MLKVLYKNLEKSDLLEESVSKRFKGLLSKFPQLKNQSVTILLGMGNSPTRPGPEQFSVKVQVESGHYKGVNLRRKSSNFHKALAETMDRMHERLKRFDEKRRKGERAPAGEIIHTSPV